MKKIKIKICGDGVQSEFSFGHFFIQILKKYYDVELSEDPDYIFFHESTSEHLKYKGIKIFYTGENIHPNFNTCDYAIGFDHLNFEDRYFRLPLFLVTVFYSRKDIELAGDTDFTVPYVFTKKDLAEKSEFCSFVYSNYLADDTRKIFFDKLCEYKKVNAGGKYLNNIGGERVASKLEFEMKHKFSIAFENSSRSGYTTEKLVNSLAAKTIPIYFGDPNIHTEFNEKRFINCHRYKNFDEVVARIKEIDNDDDLYLSIINEPVTIAEYNFKQVRKDFEVFLRNIFDQPIESATRLHINPARFAELHRNELLVAKDAKKRAGMKKFFATLYQPLKKLGFLEKLKEKYFRKTILKK